jgi:hypothetical protein
MQPKTFVRAVKERLHPHPYSRFLQTGHSPFELVLGRRVGRLTWDVFGVAEIRREQDVRGLIEDARSDVARRFGWLCYTSEISLELLLHGPLDEWWDHAGRLTADRTGFRGVMVRSVCVVDPKLGARHVSIANWGPAGPDDGVSRGGDVGVASAQAVLAAVEPLLAVV